MFILTRGMRDGFKTDVRMHKDAQLKEKIIVHECYMVNYYFPNKAGSRLTFNGRIEPDIHVVANCGFVKHLLDPLSNVRHTF